MNSTLPITTIPTSERRSNDPIDQLSRRLELSCINAVDAQQIAARLEASGINDQVAQDRYGFPDVFALAEELYYRVPLRASHAGRTATASHSWREVLRGAVFALPGVFYPVLFGLNDTISVAFALTLGMMFAWIWSQGMTRLAYLLYSRAPEQTVARFLRQALLYGIGVILSATLVLEFFWPHHGTLIALATGQVILQLCTAIFLILERHTGLLRAFTPGLVLSLAHMLFGLDERVVIAGIAVSAILTFVCALRLTSPAQPTTHVKLNNQDWLEALPYLFYGLLGATFVCFNSFALLMHEPSRAPALGLVILPLVLASGILEAELRRFREDGMDALRLVHTTQAFTKDILGIFWRGLGRYTVSLTLMSAGLYALGQLHLIPAQSTVMLLAFLMLGPAFYASSLLIAQGRVRWVITCLATALTIHALTIALTYLPRAADLEFSYLVSCAIYTTLALVAARASIPEVSHYR